MHDIVHAGLLAGPLFRPAINGPSRDDDVGTDFTSATISIV